MAIIIYTAYVIITTPISLGAVDLNSMTDTGERRAVEL